MPIGYLTWEENIDLSCLEEMCEKRAEIQTDLEECGQACMGNITFKLLSSKCVVYNFLILSGETKKLKRNIPIPCTSAELEDHNELNTTYRYEFHLPRNLAWKSGD